MTELFNKTIVKLPLTIAAVVYVLMAIVYALTQSKSDNFIVGLAYFLRIFIELPAKSFNAIFGGGLYNSGFIFGSATSQGWVFLIVFYLIVSIVVGVVASLIFHK